MAVLETPNVVARTVRVSRALNSLLALGLAAIGATALTYRFLVATTSGSVYLVLAFGCLALLVCTLVAEYGFRTAHRWARIATCVAWLGVWPLMFVILTLLVVDGAAATMAFASCIGAALLGISSVAEPAHPPK